MWDFILIVVALLFGLALGIVEINMPGKDNKVQHKLTQGALIVLASACLLCLDFMIDEFIVLKPVECLCYVAMLLGTIILPLSKKQ